MDPETPSSRFTLHPAVAVAAGVDASGDATRAKVLRDVFGEDVLNPQPGLGSGESIAGGTGRGAEGWAVVVQWTLLVILGGVIQGAAWDLTKRAGRALAALIQRARRKEEPAIMVSRGSAALLAIGFVVDLDSSVESLVIDAIEEPSAIAGHRSPEMNYVGIEPWMVYLVDLAHEVRYVVAVSSAGEILGHMRISLQRFEKDYHPHSLPD